MFLSRDDTTRNVRLLMKCAQSDMMDNIVHLLVISATLSVSLFVVVFAHDSNLRATATFCRTVAQR